MPTPNLQAKATTTLDQLPPLAPPRQCSEATGINERKLRRGLNSGAIKGVRLGRTWYVNTAALREQLGI